MNPLRRASFIVAIVAAAVGLSACGPFAASGPQTSTQKPNPAAQTPPAAMARFAKFYSQTIVWSRCGSKFQCTKLTVPLSYDDPTGATIQLAVLKAPAKSSSNRQGALVVNPGGPGGSGVDYAAGADSIVGPTVRQDFDIVGFDPRGVARSSPIRCMTDSQLDAFLAMDPTPDNAAEEQSYAEAAKMFANACAANAGPLLGHVSTVDAAKDMDILRAALGETKLNYLGKSYGTYLGAVYAGLYPALVGRFVLDGVIAPELTSAQVNEGQAVGFETATRAWAQDCVRRGGCPLGSTQEEVMQRLRDLLAQLDQHPLTRTGDPSVPLLTEGWASSGVAEAMYEQQRWPQLTSALAAVLDNGDGTQLMNLAEQYADRKKGGGYTDNIMQVIYAVNCLDKPESASLATHERLATEAESAAPTWGAQVAWSSLPCGFWPVKTAEAPQKITAAGSGPIVVVGTTRDPATPYEWSVDLRNELANAVLISYNGDGHTAYMRSNACVNTPIDRYYVSGTVPKDGLRC